MQDKTRCVTRVPVSVEGFDSLTVPLYRASTIRYPDARSFMSRFERGADDYIYGLYGTPTHRYLEKKITELEGGARTLLAPSGQAAITCSILGVVETGDRVLIPDAVYGPVRDFAEHELVALGIETVFYDPCDLQALEKELETKTRLVWVESPGSVTMEMQDVPAIVRMAHAKGSLVGCDNTWASPLNFKPLEHGADIVVEALSKHFGGHSDLLMGSITVRDEQLGLDLKAVLGRLGIGTSPDDCVLVARGIDTLAVRLAHSAAGALKIAKWLQEQPLIEAVLHPELPGFSGHELWRRDFSGAAGVFSFTLHPEAMVHIPPALDALELISIGASWGGTKSLIAPVDVKSLRTAKPWTGAEFILRLSVGMEAADDLVADLDRFLGVVRKNVSSNGEAEAMDHEVPEAAK
ncbi:trans-sulfuration enzyme family protein [Roseibium marinum]|uniref:Cystathionine beta-lyase n=1 Tax=Roseibium marinum TaxID=281252 RepID=A0A2S3UNM6_9HYPH|nr:aminotransferase class I/II-fold pyridoxal phosphate-dependent enzyme [Roseibium marinum]POF29099.1 cystathionine beta-lyase [Roseibium marinum]